MDAVQVPSKERYVVWSGNIKMEERKELEKIIVDVRWIYKLEFCSRDI